ncbi:MAG: hypothetical protein AB1782_12865 [Cyanobacteriota bacterium]
MVIRRFIGTIYIIGILILAFDVLYYIFQGFLPSIFIEYCSACFAYIHTGATILSLPLVIVIDFIVSHVPFMGSFLPVLKTEIFSAEIHWAPLFSLFIYTGILKWFDEFILKSKVNSLENKYKKDKPVSEQGFTTEE